MMNLVDKQQEAYNYMSQGLSVFITGPAGVGKSACIKAFLDVYKDDRHIAITSTTGSSALIIGGTTLHSYLGIGLGKDSANELIEKISKSKWLCKKWRELDCLIIDEISMLSPDLFDKLEHVARAIRGNEYPFGGIQLVVSGDFCFGRDTPIMMANCTQKFVQDLVEGDQVMGDDSTVRTVTRTFGGVAPMYNLTLVDDGTTYQVTGNHTLCLLFHASNQVPNHDMSTYSNSYNIYYWDYISNTLKRRVFVSVSDTHTDLENNYKNACSFAYAVSRVENTVIEMTVLEYLKLSEIARGFLYCYRVPVKKWFANQVSQSNQVSPWLVGVLLTRFIFTQAGLCAIISRQNFVSMCKQELVKHGCDLIYSVNPEDKTKVYYTLVGNTGVLTEILTNKMDDNKIPNSYMHSSLETRLELLAGIFDSCYSINGTIFVHSFYRNINQLYFLIRSVGLNYLFDQGAKYGIRLQGNVSVIPCRVQELVNTGDTSMSNLVKFTITSNNNNTSNTNDNTGVNEYYGFELDGNKRFILPNFMVSHNCQLPCVDTNKFCFEAKTWNSCIIKTIYLTKIIRQDDSKFQECLNNIRVGNITKSVARMLNSRVGKVLTNDYGIKPTILFSKNIDVDRINDMELDELAQDGREFKQYTMDIALYCKPANQTFVLEKFRKNCNAPEILQLCIGAQVMLLRNLDLENGLANGSKGTVIDFIEDIPLVKFLNGMERIIDYHIWTVEENGEDILRAQQIPLRIAYAITCHKSQGCSLDYVQVDLGDCFEYAQAYVALSRVKTLEGLSISRIDYDRIKAHPKAVEYYKKLLEQE